MFITEEVKRESSLYQQLVELAGRDYYELRIKPNSQQVIERELQQGFEKGARDAAIRTLLIALEFRFGGWVVHALGPAIEGIQDSHRLEELHREALRAESFEAFARALSMNGDE